MGFKISPTPKNFQIFFFSNFEKLLFGHFQTQFSQQQRNRSKWNLAGLQIPQSTLSLQNFSSPRQTLAKLFNFKVAGICTWDKLWKVITFDPRGQFSKFLLFRVEDIHIYPFHPVKFQKSKKNFFRLETSGSCVVKKHFFWKIKKTFLGIHSSFHLSHRLSKSVKWFKS